MFIRTSHLLLRPVWLEDWRALYHAINDEAIVRNLARVPWPYTHEDAQQFCALPQDLRYPRFLILLPASGECVGCVGIASCEGLQCEDLQCETPQREETPQCETSQAVEIGYWIARPHWGKGYASEAGAAVLDVAQSLGHRRALCGHYVDNPASGRVIAKLGFEAIAGIHMRDCRARGQQVETLEYQLNLEVRRLSVLQSA